MPTSRTVCTGSVRRSEFLAAAALATVMLTGCHHNDPDRIKPKSEVDLAELRTELITRHDAWPQIDMDKWYDTTVENCKQTPEDWDRTIAIDSDKGTNLLGLLRTSMNYVCPGRSHMVDDGLVRAQERDAMFQTACRTPPSMRTVKQQDLVDMAGCKGR